MLFGLSLSLSKKNKKKTFKKKKYSVNNWDLIHCLPFQLYYLKIFGVSPKAARLVTTNSEQNPIIAY